MEQRTILFNMGLQAPSNPVCASGWWREAKGAGTTFPLARTLETSWTSPCWREAWKWGRKNISGLVWSPTLAKCGSESQGPQHVVLVLRGPRSTSETDCGPHLSGNSSFLRISDSKWPLSCISQAVNSCQSIRPVTAYALWLLNSLYPHPSHPLGGVTLCSFLGCAHPLVAAGGYFLLLRFAAAFPLGPAVLALRASLLGHLGSYLLWGSQTQYCALYSSFFFL